MTPEAGALPHVARGRAPHTPDAVVKASQRRALARALRLARCPSCNRLGPALTGTRPPSAHCDRCGWAGAVTASFSHVPHQQGNRRTVAFDLTLETPR